MGAPYQNPPLLEATCHFRFQPSQPWDWTIAGRLFERLENAYPKRFQTQVDLDDEPENLLHSDKPEELLRLRFMRENESGFLTLGPNVLTVGRSQPYEGWDAFHAAIAQAFAAYREVAEPKGFARVTLRYVNSLELPFERFSLKDYINLDPGVPYIGSDGEKQIISKWTQQVNLTFQESDARLEVVSDIVRVKEDKLQSFVLDLECVRLRAQELPLDEAMNWLHNAHDVIERMFEACITEQARQSFQKEPHE